MGQIGATGEEREGGGEVKVSVMAPKLPGASGPGVTTLSSEGGCLEEYRVARTR